MGNQASRAQKQQKKLGFQYPWAAPCYNVTSFPQQQQQQQQCGSNGYY